LASAKTTSIKQYAALAIEKINKIDNVKISVIPTEINGINKMIENDAYCNDVLIQLSAVEKAVKSLSSHILENHLYTCVSRDLENGDLDTIDELISLFKRFNQ
jgi:DNA-binding FrmR family transcriptional regulator